MQMIRIDDLPALLDAKEVASILGVCPRNVQRMAKAGTIPSVRVGKYWRFPTAKVLAFADIEEG